jgi:TRAP-type transport system periplasmic protein
MKKTLSLTIILAFLAATLVSAAPYKATLKLASSTPMTHTYNQGAEYFAKLVSDRTDGRITMKIYPDGQLGKGERELLEALQQGTIDLYVGSTGPLGGFSQSMQILDIPFLFRSYEHADKVLDGKIGESLMADLGKSGMQGLAFWENGFRNLTNSKRPVKTPEDARGLKIRTMENAVHITAWKAAGVSPSPMAWGEVFGALQQGVMDGQENPVVVLLTTKVYEVQKYMSLTQHVYSPAMAIMSARSWAKIPKADQTVILKAAKDAAVYQRKLGRDNESKMVDELVQKGMMVTKDVDKAAFQAAMQPAFAEFAKQFGKEKIDAILNTK